MKITRLSTAVLEANYDWVLVRLDGSGGFYGLGEAYMGPGVTAILREMTPLVVGMSADDPDLLVRRLRACSIHASPGVVWHAIAGIETACLDLLGKALKQPVAKLLGGRYRDSVRVYADCHAGDALDSMTPMLQPRRPSWENAEPASSSSASLKHHGWDKLETGLPPVSAYTERAQEMVQRGFTALKFDADIPTPSPTDEYDRSLSRREIEFVIERLTAIRQTIGAAVDLAVDCHWNYNTGDAAKLIKALEPLDLLWVEDPIPPDSIRELAVLQSATSLTIATGENHYLPVDFHRLLTDGQVRIIAPDVQKIGLLQTRDVGNVADMHAAALAIHNISSPVGFAAAAHAASAIPNCLTLEWHGASVPFFSSLLREGPRIDNGRIRIGDAPGLGLEFDFDEAMKYRKPGEPFFE